ncbi:hypothetical protein CFC21_029553 [Triticum aestivum]|nr:hypothetical protein CFC21_029553 [Triticum aestivum]
MMQSLKLDLKNCLLGHDHTYHVIGISLIYDDDTYFPHARPMLNETSHSHASLEVNDSHHPYASMELTDLYHPKHVLYSYAYVIGYSIGDLEGIDPVTCIVSLVSSFSGFCMCTIQYMLTRFEVTFLGTPVDSEHGEGGKQWTHEEERSWSLQVEAKGEELQFKE